MDYRLQMLLIDHTKLVADCAVWYVIQFNQWHTVTVRAAGQVLGDC